MSTLLNSLSASDPTGGTFTQMDEVSKVQQDINEVNLFTKFVKSADDAARAAL